MALIFAVLPLDQAAAPDLMKAATPPVLAESSFMVDDDYPAEALRLKQEGSTRVLVPVNKKGKVLGCQVLESSGSPSLDKATCSIFSKLRYKPARDAEGHTVQGDFIRKMNWTLPKR
ncbi:energy transducer TonB [Sphingomonas xinjiangensis]|uniref:Protein TonB n=1 Tax=Sphingomonas xinjiangensis TaxID=643568 RepID=A0A840YU32_9SPHN|nr:energy transducer TonB [Sphingomonas xinjiangensis]MBB5713147.1 protein TonB [Sphingomonas xinjiangensis]